MSRSTWWVKWVDSAHLSRPIWTYLDDLGDGELVCYSTGWIVKRNKHSIWLASDSNATQSGRIIQIPKSAIREKRKLALRKTKGAK